jgi:hypothetical protein
VTPLPFPRWVFLLLAAVAMLPACGRTALGGRCPEGYDLDSGVCQCLTDVGCPAGFVCNQGTCECRSDGCCPTGYSYSLDSEACVCHDTSCCPKEYVWNAAEQRCGCGNQACCPGGYTYDEVAQGCRCAADACCPVGFGYDAVGKQCVCQADSCCPVDYGWDDVRMACVCAKDSCCPANYAYNASVRACVCVGDSCCPSGFIQDSAAKRCVCDASTPGSCGDPSHNFCDTASGACKCLDNQGCKAGNYCNSLGFCQSSAGCTSNIDCPSGTLCNVNTNTCVTQAGCNTDAECPFGEVCQSSTCVSGCYTTSDCSIEPATPQQSKPSCVGANLSVSPPVLGSCQPFCLTNDSCPVDSFCNTTTGTCSFNPSDVNCLGCGNNTSCGNNNFCLQFISEGQTGLFCGAICSSAADCPSGFDCGGVIFGCDPAAGCQKASDGSTPQCLLFTPVNDVPQYFCADASGQPYVYATACAPLSGTCPAQAFP